MYNHKVRLLATLILSTTLMPHYIFTGFGDKDMDIFGVGIILLVQLPMSEDRIYFI